MNKMQLCAKNKFNKNTVPGRFLLIFIELIETEWHISRSFMMSTRLL